MRLTRLVNLRHVSRVCPVWLLSSLRLSLFADFGFCFVQGWGFKSRFSVGYNFWGSDGWQQRFVEDFPHILDEDDFEIALRLFGNFFHVLAVLSGQDDFLHLRAMSGEQLLFHAADRQHI